MSAASSPYSDNTVPAALWLVYILLALYSFCVLNDSLALCGLVGFVTAFFLRRRMRARGATLGVEHATWQIHTVLISLAISLVAACVILGMALWIGHDVYMNKVSAPLAEILRGEGVLSREEFRQILAVPGMMTMLLVLIFSRVLLLFWTLKRCIQGFLTLRAGIAPREARLLSWVAVLLAIVLPLIVPFIAMTFR